jgi:hypothetical protein
MSKLPPHDWDFSDDAEQKFADWFNELVGFSFRSEWFDEDCKVKDEKTFRDMMYKWVHAAFVSGYERGRYSELREQQDT